MKFLKTLFGAMPDDGILTANFRIDEDFNCQLSFKSPAGFDAEEYINLFLNYYLRTLINLKSSPYAAAALEETFELVFKNGFNKESNILELADISDAVTIQKYSPKEFREYVVTSVFADKYRRSIYIKLPKLGYEQDMVFSVFVFLQKIVEFLDAQDVEFLLRAGRKISDSSKIPGTLKELGIDIHTPTGARDAVAAALLASKQLP